MNKTFVIFDKATQRSIGYAMVEETLIDLALQPNQEAAVFDGLFDPSASYKIENGKAVKL